jgi:hypothetical protein
MGLRSRSSSSVFDYSPPAKAKPAPSGNPDPSNWKMVRGVSYGSMLVVEIQYPDCFNYEGRKVLVFEDTTIQELKDQRLIDPHFSNNIEYKSPIARFEPTDRGWEMAKYFIFTWQESNVEKTKKG